jgi:hypothetical protein
MKKFYSLKNSARESEWMENEVLIMIMLKDFFLSRSFARSRNERYFVGHFLNYSLFATQA